MSDCQATDRTRRKNLKTALIRRWCLMANSKASTKTTKNHQQTSKVHTYDVFPNPNSNHCCYLHQQIVWSRDVDNNEGRLYFVNTSYSTFNNKRIILSF